MKLKHNKGFTLIEMLIVVTIIGILAAIVLPRFMSTSDLAKKNAHKSDRQHINAQIELFYFNTGAYPTAMTNDGWGSTYKDYYPEGVPSTCNATSGVAWAIDETTKRIVTSTHSGHE